MVSAWYLEVSNPTKLYAAFAHRETQIPMGFQFGEMVRERVQLLGHLYLPTVPVGVAQVDSCVLHIGPNLRIFELQ